MISEPEQLQVLHFVERSPVPRRWQADRLTLKQRLHWTPQNWV